MLTPRGDANPRVGWPVVPHRPASGPLGGLEPAAERRRADASMRCRAVSDVSRARRPVHRSSQSCRRRWRRSRRPRSARVVKCNRQRTGPGHHVDRTPPVHLMREALSSLATVTGVHRTAHAVAVPARDTSSTGTGAHQTSAMARLLNVIAHNRRRRKPNSHAWDTSKVSRCVKK